MVDTFGALPVFDRILAALVAGVTPRSSGFSTVAVSEMHEGTWFLTDALMFVGGGSASTAGGIKVTTLAVMLLAIIAEARGDRDVERSDDVSTARHCAWQLRSHSLGQPWSAWPPSPYSH